MRVPRTSFSAETWSKLGRQVSAWFYTGSKTHGESVHEKNQWGYRNCSGSDLLFRDTKLSFFYLHHFLVQFCSHFIILHVNHLLKEHDIFRYHSERNLCCTISVCYTGRLKLCNIYTSTNKLKYFYGWLTTYTSIMSHLIS